MPRCGRYYIQVKTEFLACPWVLMRFRLLESTEFILLAIEFSLKSVAKYKFWDSLKS